MPEHIFNGTGLTKFTIFQLWFEVEFRVTRLGEFSTIGRSFTVGSFLLITYICGQNCYSPFFHGESITWTKKCVSAVHILGDLFKNESGHPGVDVMITIFLRF
jgi:hypothetical protein